MLNKLTTILLLTAACVLVEGLVIKYSLKAVFNYSISFWDACSVFAVIALGYIVTLVLKAFSR